MATIRHARAQGEWRARSRAWPLGAGSQYKIVSWLRGGDHVSRYRTAKGCDTVTVRHDTTLGLRYARHSARLCVSIGPATRPVLGHDTAPLRATIRRSERCLGAVREACACSLGSGCAPGAPNPVLDSVHCFSHCLDHCS